MLGSLLSANKMAYVLIVSSYIAIDLFYFFSAFFVIYSINKKAREYNGLGFLTIFQIYLNRFIRFLPLYYTVFLYTWLMLFYGDSKGPLWATMMELFSGCDNYWWANIGLVNNFIPSDIQPIGVSGCMIWTTYISIELQLFLVLPLLVLIYRLHKITAIIILIMVIVAGICIDGCMIWYLNMIPGYLFALDANTLILYGTSIFSRIDSYFAGALMAFVY